MATTTMRESWLVQRLRKPNAVAEVFAFGGGLRNGGLSDEAMSLLRGVFSFDYMGAAEFEFGAVPKAIAGLARDRSLVAYDIEVEGRTVFVLCPAAYVDAVNDRLAEWASVPYVRMKEHMGFYQALHPERKRDSDTCGWLELDNGFLFFTDREMWAATCRLFGVEVA